MKFINVIIGFSIKKYPKDPVGCAYWERPEQKYLGVKSFKLTKKIIDKFQGKHDIDYVLQSISSTIPRGINISSRSRNIPE